MEGIKTALLKKAHAYGDSHVVVAYEPEPPSGWVWIPPDDCSPPFNRGPITLLGPEPEPGLLSRLVETVEGAAESAVEFVSETADSVVDWVEEALSDDEEEDD